MFGSVDDWFYRYLAGIRPADPGFATVTIEPKVPADLDAVSATVDTVRAPVAVAWSAEDGVDLDVALPPGVRGVLRPPGHDVTVEGTPADPAMDAERVSAFGEGRDDRPHLRPPPASGRSGRCTEQAGPLVSEMANKMFATA